MIFHKKIFQCVTAPIPLFQTPQKIGLLKKVVCIYSDAKLDNCKTGVIDCKIHKGDDTSNEALIKVQHLYYLNRAGKLNANYLINQPVAFVLLLLGQCDFKFIK